MWRTTRVTLRTRGRRPTTRKPAARPPTAGIGTTTGALARRSTRRSHRGAGSSRPCRSRRNLLDDGRVARPGESDAVRAPTGRRWSQERCRGWRRAGPVRVGHRSGRRASACRSAGRPGPTSSRNRGARTCGARAGPSRSDDGSSTSSTSAARRSLGLTGSSVGPVMGHWWRVRVATASPTRTSTTTSEPTRAQLTTRRPVGRGQLDRGRMSALERCQRRRVGRRSGATRHRSGRATTAPVRLRRRR